MIPQLPIFHLSTIDSDRSSQHGFLMLYQLLLSDDFVAVQTGDHCIELLNREPFQIYSPAPLEVRIDDRGQINELPHKASPEEQANTASNIHILSRQLSFFPLIFPYPQFYSLQASIRSIYQRVFRESLLNCHQYIHIAVEAEVGARYYKISLQNISPSVQAAINQGSLLPFLQFQIIYEDALNPRCAFFQIIGLHCPIEVCHHLFGKCPFSVDHEVDQILWVIKVVIKNEIVMGDDWQFLRGVEHEKQSQDRGAAM